MKTVYTLLILQFRQMLFCEFIQNSTQRSALRWWGIEAEKLNLVISGLRKNQKFGKIFIYLKRLIEMTLSFSTKWPERMGELAGQPNYFIDKIWHGLLALRGDISSLCADRYYENHIQKLGFGWDLHEEDPLPKLHTIRHDPHNRWKPGMKIHPVINNRTKNRFQFAPVVKCVIVQKIEIKYWNKCSDYPNIIIDKHYGYHAYEKDGFEFMEQLALNDGFPSVEAFFQYFNVDFNGKLIHWTNLKY